LETEKKGIKEKDEKLNSANKSKEEEKGSLTTLANILEEGDLKMLRMMNELEGLRLGASEGGGDVASDDKGQGGDRAARLAGNKSLEVQLRQKEVTVGLKSKVVVSAYFFPTCNKLLPLKGYRYWYYRNMLHHHFSQILVFFQLF
jgi:hypothetical protein